MSVGGRELIAADKSTVGTKSSFDVSVVEGLQSDGGLPDSSGTDESDGYEAFGHTDDLVDQLVTAEAGPRSRRGRFTRNAK